MTNNESINYEKNYLRNPILDLLKYHKPVIITASLYSKYATRFYTFKKIRPFSIEYPNSLTLCDHINIDCASIKPYLTQELLNSPSNQYVLICYPYIYYGDNGAERGGLRLYTDWGISPIMAVEDAKKIVPTISSELYVDFFEFSKGKYLCINKKIRQAEKLKRRKARKALCQTDNGRRSSAMLLNATQWDRALRSQLSATGTIKLSDKMKRKNPSVNNVCRFNTNSNSIKNKSILLHGWYLRV